MNQTNGVVEDAQTHSQAAMESMPLELRILDLFHSGRILILGPTDVEKHLGVSKGTVSAKLRSLEQAGYLHAVSAGRYQLGPRLSMLWVRYMHLLAEQVEASQHIVASALEPVRSLLMEMAGRQGGRS